MMEHSYTTFRRRIDLKRSISVAEVEEDLTSMPDEELMTKYGFSKDELETFFDKFLITSEAGQQNIEWESQDKD
jgi:hypothetical protein